MKKKFLQEFNINLENYPKIVNYFKQYFELHEKFERNSN